MKRKIIIGIIVIVIIAASFLIYQSIQKGKQAALSQFQTYELQRGELSALVGATGSVHANQTSTISWLINGRIEKIHVKAGEKAKKGKVLAELSEDSLPQSIILAHADLITNQRALDKLLDSEVEMTKAYQSLVKAQDELEDALDARKNLDFGRANQNTIDGARADYLLAEDKVKDAEKDYSNVEYLPEDDRAHILALSNLAAARKQRDQALANLNYLISSADSLEIAEADARVEVAQANLEDTEREYDRLKNGPDPEDVEAAKARIASSQAILKQSYLEAPFDGTITEVNSKIGDEVATGTATFRIDDLSHLIIDVDIPEVDINRIEAGQDVKLNFDAVQNKEYLGTVTEVAGVGTTTQGVVNFAVSIELDDFDDDIHPGMTAAVNIVVTKLDDVLLVPNRAVRNRDNKRIIYILKDGVPEVVEIEVGASSEVDSEITAGEVNEGDLVILNPPAELMMSGGSPHN